MNACKLIITSNGRDWQNKVSCQATYCQEGENTLLQYQLDGDACRMQLNSGELFQSRKGQVNLDLHFLPNLKTACYLSTGQGRGSYPIYTTAYFLQKKPNGLQCCLSYESGEDKEPIKLKITVIYSK